MTETPPLTAEALDDFLTKARAASNLLKALSHETRLLMLCMLCQGEKTVTEIEHFLGIQQAVVSQQLARLRSDKVVQTRREGRQIYYRIADPQLAELISVLYKMYCGPLPMQRSEAEAHTGA
ncbi:ArsR/SmtB family transcription factor [Rhizobium rosettiformans]|jgi:DNA-binding transcriptional ArsR family regulator|uniref:Winged helix-turn-helix transcriptional regulator n=2 Tax=Rhizobium rosettiformans TaxID=1368430 RepID=A0A4S8Q0A9_9HYPH|nr:metalloregulator ArsR/SmtB family transcription factor [Rhizobium rosettiformans]MBB5275731.1 DNA-binding transcriptional ArsR family regulator [Rhizobium rosettiformans]MDR7030297.1 DNA-binding transcriptional ArsR family regulator [Rhizobium rosettiformans]MDR7065722.1 DNA-binding transcriptional ArsR family regulator [Rhizobium rosettiformans]THV37473.1 winged helix-turn-helix transcriptional regulator [Rhizobium rosettiformans W3]